MKKGLIISISVLILLILILGFYGYQKYSLQKSNTAVYNFLECETNCPLTQINNFTIFDQNCSFNCAEYIKEVPEEMASIGGDSEDPTPKNSKYGDKVIIGSEEHIFCFSFFTEERDIAKYQSCLKDALPTLKEKYNIK